MVSGESARLSPSAMHTRPVSRIPHACCSHRPRKEAGRMKTRRGRKIICQRPGSIPQRRLSGPYEHNREQCARAGRRQELLDRHADHCIRHARVHAMGAGYRLHTNQGSRHDGRLKSRYPDRMGCDWQDRAARCPALRLHRWQENPSQPELWDRNRETPSCAPSVGVCC